MNRCFSWAMLIAAGMVISWALNAHDRSVAASPAVPDTEAEHKVDDLIGQMKDINTHLKSIDTLLQSGTLKVVVVINPERR
jgi:hypothetical protein